MSFIVKNTTFPNILDLISPHSCRGCGRTGKALCDCCKNNLILKHKNYCPNCKNLAPSGFCQNCTELPLIFTIGFRDELIGKLIQDFKFHSVRALALPLAEILNHILPNIKKPKSVILHPINKDKELSVAFYVNPEINRAIIEQIKIHSR